MTSMKQFKEILKKTSDESDEPNATKRMFILSEVRFQAAVLLTLFIAAHWLPLKTLVTIWWTNEDYSYGFLIPVVSAYLLWEKRKVIDGLQIRSAWLMLPLLVVFFLLSLYGTLGSSGNVSMPSIPILIMLYAAFCFGLPLVKKLIMPLGFLIFMIPVPPSVETSLGIFLKSISSKMGGWIIHAVNIPVYVSGNVIDIGITQLQVVDACSGMRYVFALFALGVLYSYFFESHLWKRIVCVLTTIPIAIITNALRIGATGILANYYGVKVAEGFFHGFSGWVIFMVAFAFLFLMGRLLRLFPPHGLLQEDEDRAMSATNERNAPIIPDNRGAFFTAIAMMIVFGLLSLSTRILPPIMMQGGIASFSLSIAEWQGRSEFISPDIIEKSGAEESFSANYRNRKSDSVSLYIGYRSTAFLSNENFFHTPTVCLPSSGWETKSISTREIQDVPKYGRLKVSTMIIENFGVRQIVYFWFQTKDKTSHDKNINRFHLALHAIKRDNTYDLFIRPITMVRPNETIEDAEKRMDGFVRDMMNELLKFLMEKQQAG